MPERLLLCTDLDRTLIPNGPQAESPAARTHFALLAAHPQVVLAYVTGRHRELVEDALAQYCLPLPDFVIGDVGTTIYRLEPGGDWRQDQTWNKRLDTDWHGKTSSDLQQVLAGIADLQLQECSKQNTHKLSYYVPLDSDREQLARSITRRLVREGLGARLVWSVDEPAAIGLLDVLPETASKYHAIAMLQSLQGFTDRNTVFSGDSGNDIEVLASSIPAVLVANSEPTVRAEALRRAAEVNHSDQLYLARGGFHGMNGNYSAGILEGIAHYHPALVSWMGLGAIA